MTAVIERTDERVDDSTLTLADIEELANWAIAEHLDDGWVFEWDRAKSRLGACHFRGLLDSRPNKITLSKPLFSIPENRHDVLDTILHEVAHALAGHHENHGSKWKKICVEIGARPNRLYEAEKITPIPVTWLGLPDDGLPICPCGTEHGWHRKPKYKSYTCRATGTKLIPIKVP